MPTCANCNEPTDYSNSNDHPLPFKNLWLCVKCFNEKMPDNKKGSLPAPNIVRGEA